MSPQQRKFGSYVTLGELAEHLSAGKQGGSSTEPEAEEAGYAPSHDDSLLRAVGLGGDFIGRTAGAFEAAVAGVQELATYVPEAPDEVAGFLAERSDFISQLAAAVHAMAERTSAQNFTDNEGNPISVEPAVDDLMRSAELVAALARGLEEAAVSFEPLNAGDMDRYQHPRPKEGMWNVGSNGEAGSAGTSYSAANLAGGAALAGAPESYTPSATRPQLPATAGYFTPKGIEVVPGQEVPTPFARGSQPGAPEDGSEATGTAADPQEPATPPSSEPVSPPGGTPPPGNTPPEGGMEGEPERPARIETFYVNDIREVAAQHPDPVVHRVPVYVDKTTTPHTIRPMLDVEPGAYKGRVGITMHYDTTTNPLVYTITLTPPEGFLIGEPVGGVAEYPPGDPTRSSSYSHITGAVDVREVERGVCEFQFSGTDPVTGTDFPFNIGDANTKFMIGIMNDAMMGRFGSGR